MIIDPGTCGRDLLSPHWQAPGSKIIYRIDTFTDVYNTYLLWAVSLKQPGRL